MTTREGGQFSTGATGPVLAGLGKLLRFWLPAHMEGLDACWGGTRGGVRCSG
jgi:hypothetical protein